MTDIYQRLVDHFRTQQATADAIGVDQSTVSGWVRGKFGMRPDLAVKAEKATNGAFSREELCPNFPWEDLA